MKRYVWILIAVLLSFQAAMAQKPVKLKTKKIEIIKGAQPRLGKISKKGRIKLITPKDKTIVNDDAVTFSWKSKLSKVVLTVLDVDPNLSVAENIAKANVVFERTLTSKKTFSTSALPKNRNLLWSISSVNGKRRGPWSSFFYSDLDFAGPESDCRKNRIRDPDFQSHTRSWITQGSAKLSRTDDGCDSPGYATIGNKSGGVLKQMIATPLVAGKNYALKFCFKNEGNNPTANAKIIAVAFKGTPANFTPSSQVAIIYPSGNLPIDENWIDFEAPVWTATDSFDQIAFIVSSNLQEQYYGVISLDNICLSETNKDPCEYEYDIQLDSGGGFTITDKKLNTLMGSYSPSINETNHDYVRGVAADLYGYAGDTDTDLFYENLDLSSPCFSVGGYDPKKEFDDIDSTIDSLKFAGIDEKIKKASNKVLNLDFLPKDFKDIEDVGYPCDYQVPDPSLPFGGADIVYVHGFAMDHILEALHPNPKKFESKWPNQPNAFYTGDYKTFADDYWKEHIQSQITDGQGRLTNRYMTVAWPSDQRLGDGIHSVLQQISQAIISGKGVVYNENDNRKARCFGDRIVMVSHSAGGMLVSSLLGLGELSKTDAKIIDAYGPNISKITDRVAGHIAFTSAHSGSKLASLAVVAPKLLGAITGGTSTFAGIAAGAVIVSYEFVIHQSVLMDLLPPVSQYYWATNYYGKATKPTLTVAGSTPGLPQSGAMGWPGKFFIKGYSDGVVSMDCACGSNQKWWLRSSFLIKNPFKIWDFGNPVATKAIGLSWDSKYNRIIPLSPVRISACIPYLTPSGMLTPYWKKISKIQRWGNHYSLIQSSMTHFDATGEILNYYPNNSPSIFGNIKNDEESRVVTDPSIYSLGYVENDFKRINVEHIRKKTIGFHLPGIKRSRRFPWFKVYWKYYEITIWKRTYHLLRNHRDNNSSDYIYAYTFRS